MHWRRRSLIVVVVLLGGSAGCEREEPRRTGFVEIEEATPVSVVIIRRDTTITPDGYRVAELDVLLPPQAGEATARATLQHLIDSLAVADTLAAAVRITGFVMDSVDRARGTADILPAIRATWGPIDTAGFTGARRRSRYRTDYLLIRPLDRGGETGRVP